MLFEILSVLTDLACHADYIDAYLSDLITGHLGFGVRSKNLYSDFIDAVNETVIDALGDGWPLEERIVWMNTSMELKNRVTTIAATVIAG